MSASSDSAKPALQNTLKQAATQPADTTAAPNRLPYLSNLASDVANSWLLPDGVVDVLFEDAHKQEVLRHQLIQQLISHGYQLVNPPMIEFTESLLSGASEDLKRQTFKIIDQLTGRLMGIRADITPQILRIDAHHGGDGVARYCYAGDVIHTLPSGLFGSRTPLQLGAEIFGCESITADIELIDVLF
ncbi:ATP phosphoribosyltransferase regulatory subunit, partial [Psychrobacter sp.]|uniref:ATP phosphoribosyltransferase regulatory subunit n=1 Tax=Psychrobacter sp. TaxID=56811 RepID=UPI0035697351